MEKLAFARPLGNKFRFGGGKADLFHRYLASGRAIELTYAKNS